ncbi:PHB depolymerase family esterase [Sphingomicrobium sp. XHP0239]|uniref:extracellular catalytic domain type 1 short-chain-length polyhydroxyalkanoate depolymerase n=1 Tax=Sphingomicrobium maritimum TaxID=3133972 RepID=UPI0031CCCB59
MARLVDFGPNPGDLEGWFYVPASIKPNAALVVVLHGCTQTAAAYDRGAAWTKAADDHGFILLFPEQQRANNPNLCFNWFSPRDARRGRGEAASIAEMIQSVTNRFDVDEKQIFVTGLSAGGAMAAVMLAAYPDTFAGGAVIAGLPYATANNVPQALERMRGQDVPDAGKLGQIVRSASQHEGPWPTLSVWHGTQDATVDRSNARAIVDQWRALHAAPGDPQRSDMVNGHVHHVWQDAHGRDVIEEYQIAGLGHGTPLSTRHSGSGEMAGPHMLEAGISSTTHILQFWKIATDEAVSPDRTAPLPETDSRKTGPVPNDIKRTIEQALQAAGLLR